MFFKKKKKTSDLVLACCVGDDSYSLALVKNNKKVVFSQRHVFSDVNVSEMSKVLASEVERLKLITHDCRLILLPNQYQLISTDALDVPDAEMAQALRWGLKGLSDYDLDDVALDVFPMPKHPPSDVNKVVVAITPLSTLNERRALLRSSFLEVKQVGIASLMLKKLLLLMQSTENIGQDEPVIIVSLFDSKYVVHLLYEGLFHLIRVLELGPSVTSAVLVDTALDVNSEASSGADFDLSTRTKPEAIADVSEPFVKADTNTETNKFSQIMFELERSIYYSVNTLGLPETKKFLFTPGFHQMSHVFQSMGGGFSLDVSIIDLNDYLMMDPPLSLEAQDGVFYSILGALSFNETGSKA